MKRERLAARFDRRAETQIALRMHERERRAVRHAEQQFRYRVLDGRLAGLVRTDDEMEIELRRWKLDGVIGELAVADEFELTDTHGLLRVRELRDQARTHLAHELREFAVA